MQAECSTDEIRFKAPGGREIVCRFDGGRMSSDGGALLLAEAARALGLPSLIASCMTDHRDPRRVEHGLEGLVMQRLLGILLGDEDLNDHHRLRDDSVIALAAGREDVTGEGRSRERDRGHPQASPSTLNRMELGDPETAEGDRYKRIVGHPERFDDLLVRLFLGTYGIVSGPAGARPAPPEEIVLDIDTTDVPLHGDQEGKFYHGYYRSHCYLPLYVFCGEHPLRCRLRTADVGPASGALAELAPVVGRIRERWPETRIVVRGDSGFCHEDIMAWCEANGVHYILGIRRNQRLQRAVARHMRKSRRRCAARGEASRRFRSLRYRPLDRRKGKGWSRARRVVAKAEWLPGRRGYNPRFIVTNLDGPARELYERDYCARGEMENQIKGQQLDLFADRASAGTMRANQLRLYMSAIAAAVFLVLRAVGLRGTRLGRAQLGTIRTTLLKCAATVKVTTRRIWLSLSSVHPLQEVFMQALARLRAVEIDLGGPAPPPALARPPPG